jgi:hypothetical protein
MIYERYVPNGFNEQYSTAIIQTSTRSNKLVHRNNHFRASHLQRVGVTPQAVPKLMILIVMLIAQRTLEYQLPFIQSHIRLDAFDFIATMPELIPEHLMCTNAPHNALGIFVNT